MTSLRVLSKVLAPIICFLCLANCIDDEPTESCDSSLGPETCGSLNLLQTELKHLELGHPDLNDRRQKQAYGDGQNDAAEVTQAEALDHRVVGAHAPKQENVQELQDHHATGDNRYPAIFTLLKELVDKDTVGRNAKLLSFGCSYGAECHSLRQYFPDAHIHGVDISKDVIEKATANNTDPLISFFSDTAELESESYDAVLAMGVLCHQGILGFASLTREKYSQAVGILDRLVRPGGYMVIYNADHTFDVYPRHASFANACTGSTTKKSVSTADMLYSTNLLEVSDPLKRGMCSLENKFCIESGWLSKTDAKDKVVQEYMEGDQSNGCLFAGPFFKKKESILTETN